MKKRKSNYYALSIINCARLFLLLFFTISISISSCKKDTNFLDRREVVNYVDANNLKLWFNQTPAILIGNKGNWFNTLTPNWEKVQRFENDLENVYEIDLNNPDHIFTAASEIDVKRMETFERKSLFKLIVFENKLDKKLNAAIMEMVAFEGNRIALAQLHYKNYKTFSGAVNYYELNGQLANGWLYKEGEIIAKTGKNMELSGLSFDNSLSSLKGKVMLAQANVVECGSISVPHWRESCNTVGGDTGDGWAYDAGLVVTTCRWEIYHTTEIIYCPVSDGGGPSGGGYTGGSSGGSTGTTNDPADDPDCGKVKQQTSTTAYKEKVNDLKVKTNLNKETGFEEKKDGSFTPLTNDSDDKMNAIPVGDTKGFMHTHVDRYLNGKFDENGSPLYNSPIKMFSPADVNRLMAIVNKNRISGDYSDYYVSMVSSNGNYMIKFSGTESNLQMGFHTTEWANSYEKFMNDFINLEKGFLQFLKNKMGVNGVKLYKIENNGDVKAIQLKSDGKSVDKKDC